MNSDLESFVPLVYRRRGIQRLAATDNPAHDTAFLVGLGRALSGGGVNSGFGEGSTSASDRE